MNIKLGHWAASALACAGLLAGLATNASAKAAWESHAGGEGNDAARGGMVQTPDGGFISVGESQSFGRGDYDVYVVKVDICGSFQWSNTYDIGGNDYGRRVRLDPDGGYIITGETENARNCCTRDDAFLMKLDEDGGVQWTKTYGGKGVDRGNDVQLYYKGERGYVIAGSTTSFGAGRTDGWLIATDRDGTVLWSRVYGGTLDDGFNGVVQTNNNDLAATGVTNSYGLGRLTDNDVYIVRTSSIGDVIWSYHYGSRGEDVGTSIIDAPSADAKLNDLVVAGYIAAFNPKAEAYLLRVNANGVTITDHVYGGANTEGRDEFRDLALSPDASGDIYAVGRIMEPNTGFGGYDVFAVRVDAALNLVWARNHGGKLDDEAYAIGVDFEQSGHGFAGVSNSFTFGREDMYMGLAFNWGDDFCHDAEPDIANYVPEFKAQKAPTTAPHVWVECSAKVEPVRNESYEIICSTCFGGGGGLEENGQQDLSFNVPLRNPNLVRSNTANVTVAVNR